MQTIIGKITEKLPIISGETTKGKWVKGGIVIEYGDEYPRKAAFTYFGEEKVEAIEAMPINTIVQVNYQPESREHEDRWYTELRCFSVTPINIQNPQYPH